jgi:origin recognition complex subunit 1
VNLIERVKNETKATRKKRDDRHFVDDLVLGDDQDDTFQTPKKRRKTSKVSTPSKEHTPSKMLTPSHKRYKLQNSCTN